MHDSLENVYASNQDGKTSFPSENLIPPPGNVTFTRSEYRNPCGNRPCNADYLSSSLGNHSSSEVDAPLPNENRT